MVRLELQSIGHGLAGWHYLCVVIFNVGHGQELHRLALEENLEGQSAGCGPFGIWRGGPLTHTMPGVVWGGVGGLGGAATKSGQLGVKKSCKADIQPRRLE